MGDWFNAVGAVSSVDINDRGFQYADGLFETIAVRDGTLRLWPMHIERLQTGCRRLGFEPPDTDVISELAMTSIGSAGFELKDALLKIIITRGFGARGYLAPEAPEPSLYVGLFDRTLWPEDHYRKGVTLRICNSRLATQPQTAGIKLLSRTDQILARGEWRDPDIAEGLMRDQHGAVVCGTMSNLFLVAGQRLLTPEIANCGVSGVMRRHILALADANRIEASVQEISTDMLKTSDEIFICNSQIGIWPVSRIGTTELREWPLTESLMNLLADSGVDEGPA